MIIIVDSLMTSKTTYLTLYTITRCIEIARTMIIATVIGIVTSGIVIGTMIATIILVMASIVVVISLITMVVLHKIL